MSELTSCNFCSWERMKSDGGYRKATKADREKLDHDKDEEFSAAFGDGVTIVTNEGKFAAWFMSLPDHCCC